MNFTTLAVKNVFRSRFRAAFTILGVATAILPFVVLETAVDSVSKRFADFDRDRVATKQAVSHSMRFPKRYVDDIEANVPNAKTVAYAIWFGGRFVSNPRVLVVKRAVSNNWFDVYRFQMPPEQLATWKTDRQGAVVGEALAAELGWKVGDHVTVEGDFYPGNYELTIDALYTPRNKADDPESFFFHYDYFNETVPADQKDKVGYVITRADDEQHVPAVAAAIDRLFADRDQPTSSMSEGALLQSYLGGAYTPILSALQIVSIVILGIMMLILGNTIAMGVRERTSEYGVMLALGFRPRDLALIIFGEGIATGLAGGILGVGLAFALVNGVLSPMFQHRLLPYWHVEPTTIAFVIGLTVVLSIVASALPAIRATRLQVVDALRRVD